MLISEMTFVTIEGEDPGSLNNMGPELSANLESPWTISDCTHQKHKQTKPKPNEQEIFVGLSNYIF